MNEKKRALLMKIARIAALVLAAVMVINVFMGTLF